MRLFSRCFVCAAELSAEPVTPAEENPAKYAFDPARGRLWVVCIRCGAWNLVPIEARWEAIEVLERTARDRGRVLARTDNVALIEAGNTTLIRIGATQRKEEAWWRYLKEAEHRRDNARRIVRRGRWRDAFINLLIWGVPIPAGTEPETWIHSARVLQFSRSLWTGPARCGECGALAHDIRFADPVTIVSRNDELRVRGRCAVCRAAGGHGMFEIADPIATRIVQRKLAYTNYAGASEPDLNGAVGILDSFPSAASFVHTVFANPVLFTQLKSPQLIAFEMAVNEAREVELLNLEVRELEARWRVEEEIAFIVDRELTP